LVSYILHTVPEETVLMPTDSKPGFCTRFTAEATQAGTDV
jgi:hypothetical protein